MLREIIRPQSSRYLMNIPKEYINKDIEILILPLEDDKTTKEIKQRLQQYKNKEIETKCFSDGLNKIRENIVSKL